MGAPRALVGLALAVSACAPVHNYDDPRGPRYAVAASPRPDPSPVLKVVTFNVRYALFAPRAAEVLVRTPALSDADLVVLQEMDLPGVQVIASALAMNAVYYPAAVHHRHGKDFGNAVLFRGPIEADGKLLLPHPARIRGMQRIATWATVKVGGWPVRVYSVHLGAASDVFPAARMAQVQAILEDARAHERVIVAGDFNERTAVGRAFEAAGYTWLTRDAGPTVSRFSWDHLFARGLEPARPEGWGVADPAGASDHSPVWAALLVPELSASNTARRTASIPTP
ncbi:MAG TPA: endonuclease/exonuclease/phosphatase family protein [Vicinamibacteria bacterium]|nr:endonuclease/exonuclease/phosphatase family protein [Vicinamibacteria bacterium]